MDEILLENSIEEQDFVEEQREDDIIAEVLDDNTIEGEPEIVEETADLTEDTVDVTETENPVIDETVFSEEEITDNAGLEGETAEPITDIETVEDIEEETEPEAEPVDAPVIEEAVIPSYIAHAAEIGTRENPVRANGGAEVFVPTLLRQ